MASTTSVSQGSFLLLPKDFNLSKIRKNRKRKLISVQEENWEKNFNTVWEAIDKEIKEVNEKIFKNVLKNLITHIKSLYNETKMEEGVLPCEIFLTGSNLPDHSLLINALTDSLKEITPYISILESRNCGTIKNTITSFVKQIIRTKKNESDSDFDEENSDGEIAEKVRVEEENKTNSKFKFQMFQYNLLTLCAWHTSQTKKKKKCPIIIFLPDFESMSSKILSEFILLLSSYSSQAPFILIFGVATTPSVIYQSLSRRVLSQLVIHLFKSEQSITFLNQIIEKIFFSEKCPFRLGSKCMTFLTDIFLFHSFSVQGFIQGFKFCMMEHFYNKNHFSLCCFPKDIEDRVKSLKLADIESIRRLPSFRKHVENSSKDDRKLLLLDNNHTKKIAEKMIKQALENLNNFHVALKCLHILTSDLPQYPLGRHLREYYCKAVSKDITSCSEYKESIKMLHYQSRNELASKVSLIVDFLKSSCIVDIISSNKKSKFDEIINNLKVYQQKFSEMPSKDTDYLNDENLSEFKSIRKSFLSYVEKEVINKLIQPLTNTTFHEIILFDDLAAVRRKISGSPRGAIHLALNNPQYYLECKCCKLPNGEAVLATLPDLSVAYKLHLEFSKVINLYDWLQAFAACIKPELSEIEIEMDEEIQARFTRAVSELQFLGFIKPSRSKSDYVNRLTWNSS